MEYQSNKGADFFSAESGGDKPSLLMFGRSSHTARKEQIPQMMASLAEGFLNEARTSSKFKLESDKYLTGKIGGAAFTGEFAEFSFANGRCATMFLISDGDGIWSGQFIGSKERWAEALGILKKLKKADRRKA